MAKTKRKTRSKPASQADVDRLRRGIIALYRAVAALAHEVTGRRMSIRIERGDGDEVWTTPDLAGVRWAPKEENAAAATPTAEATPDVVLVQRKIGF